MNKDLIKKYFEDPKKFILPGVFIGIIGFGWFLCSSAKMEKLKQKEIYEKKEIEIEIKKEKILEIPSEKKMAQMRDKYKRLQTILKESLLSFQSEQKDVTPLLPLPFKEELLKNQQRLETMSGGFEFPRGFGFVEYLDIRVPEKEKLADLTKEMYVTYEIMKILYKNNVDNITFIERLGVEKEYSRETGNKGTFIKIYSVKFEAESDFLNFMEAFRELAYSKQFFIIVDELSAKKIGKDKIKASFILRVVEFT